MEAQHYQSNFTAGEFSPRMFGRTDLAKYGNACALLENFLIQQQGGAVRRPGTRFVAPAKNQGLGANHQTRLVAFQFSTIQTYTLEFGHLYVRFYETSARLVAAPPAAWAIGTAYGVDNLVSFGGINYYCILANTGNTPPNPTYWYPQALDPDSQITAPGTTIYEIPTPYTADQLVDLKFTQSADILFLCHPAVPPQELRRRAPLNWSFVPHQMLDGPYLDINTTTITLTPAAATGTNILITASNPLFAATDVGRVLRFRGTALWGWAIIKAFNSSTTVHVDIQSDFDATTAGIVWRLGTFTSVNGYPGAVAFHQERLYFANCPAFPQTIWGSSVGEFNNFAPSETVPSGDISISDSDVVTASDAITYTIDDDRVNSIQWMLSSAKGLILLTTGAEFLLGSTSTFDPITATNVGVLRQSTIGCSTTAIPSLVGVSALFVQFAGRRLLELSFDFYKNQYIPQNMSLLSDHITLTGVTETAYQQEPSGIIWMTRNDGQLIAMTYQRDQDVVAWHRHPLGGTDVFVESIAIIRDPTIEEDQVWLLVRRTVNGNVVRYVEFIEQTFDYDTTQEQAYFVDCGLSYDGYNVDPTKTLTLTGGTTWGTGDTGVLTAVGATPFNAGMTGRIFRFRNKQIQPWVAVQITLFVSSTVVNVAFINPTPVSIQGVATPDWGLTQIKVAGLDHLEGQTVKVLVDGATHPDCVVMTGTISLQGEGAVVSAGLAYASTLVTVPMVEATQAGSSQGRRTRPFLGFFRFHQTLGGTIQTNSGPVHEIDYRTPQAEMNVPPGLYTGQIRENLSTDASLDNQVTVQATDPLPMTLLGVNVFSQVTGPA